MNEDDHLGVTMIHEIGRCLKNLIGRSAPKRHFKTDPFICKNMRKGSDVHELLTCCYVNMHIAIECFVLAMVLVDKIGVKVTRYNSCNMFGIAVMIATKVHDDYHMSNIVFAQIIGVSLFDINCMERKFLHLLNFDAGVDTQTYSEYYDALMANVRMKVSPRAN